MDVYSCPDQVPYNFPDLSNIRDCNAVVMQSEDEHKKKLILFLKNAGYDSNNTGRILSEPQADSYAHYMFAEANSGQAILIHLPYGDGWESPNVGYLPKEEVLRRIGANDRVRALFKKG